MGVTPYGSAGRYLYVSSTGVYWSYHSVEIPESGRVLLTDDPPQAEPSYGVMKALSENEVRGAFPDGALIIRPRLLEDGTTGTFNAVGPGRRQTMREFVHGLAAVTSAPLTWTWISDNAWLRSFPLRTAADGSTRGLEDAVPWIMPLPDELGHMRIDGSRAVAAGLTFRPLATTAQDSLAWRASDAVPAALRDAPRYVLSPEDEARMLAAWRGRGGG